MSQSSESDVPPYVSIASVKTLLHGFGNSEFKATSGGVTLINWFLDEFLQLITTSACDEGLEPTHITTSILRLFPDSLFAQNLVEYAGYVPKPIRFGIGSGVGGERRRGIYSPLTVFESLRVMSLHYGALGKRTDKWHVTQLARDLIPTTTALFASRVLEHLAHSIVISAVVQLQQLTITHQQLVKPSLLSAPSPELCLDNALVMLALTSDPQLAVISTKIRFRDLVDRTHSSLKPPKSTFHQLSQILVVPENQPTSLSQRILNKLRSLKPRPPELPLDKDNYEDTLTPSLGDPITHATEAAFDKVIRSSATQRISLTPSHLQP